MLAEPCGPPLKAGRITCDEATMYHSNAIAIRTHTAPQITSVRPESCRRLANDSKAWIPVPSMAVM